MPALIPTDHFGTIEWLGVVPHREHPDIECTPLSEMTVDFAGYVGDCHSGLTRGSCSRVTSQYPKGTTIRNTRQLSLVSGEELDDIAATMGLNAIDPAWVGASMVLRGIPDFSHLPPSSRLQSASGATLTIDMQNRPCKFPALTIAKHRDGLGKSFKTAAEGKRGVTAWVERAGVLRLNEAMRLHIPDQRGWQP